MRFVRFGFALIALWISLLLLFCGMMYMSERIDKTTIRGNVIQGLELLSSEGDYPRFAIGDPMLQKDNFTDAIMLGETVSFNDSLSSFQNSLYAYACSVDSTSTLTDGTLACVLNPDSGIDSYGRYWHGYKSTLRPALKVMSLRGIRIMNYVLLYLLAAAAFFLMLKRLGGVIASFFLIALISVGFPLVPDTLQFCTCFYISLIVCIIFLAIPQKYLSERNCALCFFAIGAFTSFYDFLTTPLVSLGLPLSIVLLRRNRLPDIKLLILCCIMWGTGYAGLWVSKWILCEIFTDYSMLDDAFRALNTRSSHVISLSNQMKFSHVILAYSMILILICFCLATFQAKRKIKENQLSRYYPFALLGLSPIVWVTVFQNHSFYHFWFVWRIFAVTVFNLLIFFYYSFYKPHHERYCDSDTLLQ